MPNIINSLAIEVVGSAEKAIEALSGVNGQLLLLQSALEKVNKTKITANFISPAAIDRISGLRDAISGFKDSDAIGFMNAINGLKSVDVSGIQAISDASKGFSSFRNIEKIDTARIVDFAEEMNQTDFSGIRKLADAAKGLSQFSSLARLSKEGAADNLAKSLSEISNINANRIAQLGEATKSLRGFSGLASFAGLGFQQVRESFDALRYIDFGLLERLSQVDFSNMRDLADASRVIKKLAERVKELEKNGGKAADSQKKLASSVKKTGSAANRSTGGLKKLLQSIKRIVFYRAIRSAIRAITQGFGEGIQNLYYWSQSVGTSFAPAMDRLATATQYLKNGFASMWSPLIEYAIPILDRVIDKLVDFFNFIQEGFAQLTGAETWNRALKFPTTYAEALDDASASAKELKGQLMGFDELNVINTPSDSSRGKAKDAKDYSSMFELVKTAAGNNFDNLGVKLADSVNKVFENPEKWEEWGGKLADFVSKGFDNAVSFLENVNWTNIGASISKFVSKFTAKIATKIKDTDWGDVIIKLTEALCNVIEGADTNELLKSFAKLFAAIATALPSIFLASIESALNVIATILEKIGWGGAADKVRGWSNGIKDFRKGYEKARGIVLDALWNQLDYGSVMPNSTRGFEYDPTQDQGRSFDSSGSVIGQMASKDGMQLKMDIVTFLNDEESSFTQTYNKFKEFVDGAKALGAKLVFPIVFTMARIVPKVQEKWNEFKQWWTDKKAEIKLWVASIKDKVLAKWNEFVTWWSQKKEEIKLIAPSIKALVQQKWTEFTNWWSLVKADLNARFTAPDIKSKVLAGWNTFQSWFANVKLNFTERFQVPDLVSKISTAWQNLKNWLSWNPLKFNIQTPHLSLAPGYSLNPVQWVKNSATIPKLSVSWYAQGGYLPDSYTLIGAGENGIPEMLGSINGRSAVAGGAEITGIRDAILSQGEREENLLRQLITAINNKDLNLVANSQTGRWVSKALKSYQGVTG